MLRVTSRNIILPSSHLSYIQLPPEGDDGKWWLVLTEPQPRRLHKVCVSVPMSKSDSGRHSVTLRIRKGDMPDDDGSHSVKKAKTDGLGLVYCRCSWTLNYTGTTWLSPPPLSMKEATYQEKAPKGWKVEGELSCGRASRTPRTKRQRPCD
jgi:hypothetical protein